MLIHAQFFRWVILTRKVGQTGLVFGVWFISRLVHARLQVSVCCGYDLCQPAELKIYTKKQTNIKKQPAFIDIRLRPGIAIPLVDIQA